MLLVFTWRWLRTSREKVSWYPLHKAIYYSCTHLPPNILPLGSTNDSSQFIEKESNIWATWDKRIWYTVAGMFPKMLLLLSIASLKRHLVKPLPVGHHTIMQGDHVLEASESQKASVKPRAIPQWSIVKMPTPHHLWWCASGSIFFSARRCRRSALALSSDAAWYLGKGNTSWGNSDWYCERRCVTLRL